MSLEAMRDVSDVAAAGELSARESSRSGWLSRIRSRDPGPAPKRMAASTDWADRATAVRQLTNHVGDSRARAELVRGLGDVDTAVVAAATGVLVRVGGVAGMRDVLQHLARSDDETGYHIRDRLIELWMGGYPVLDAVRNILRGEPPGPICDGASEILQLLEAR